MSWARTAVFHEQLAVTLEAGLGMAQALQLAGDTAGGPLRSRGRAWSAGCAAGQGLAVQLADQPAFDRALVQAGETSGRLPAMCRDLAAHYRQRLALRNLVIGRLVYPVVLIHVALLALAVVLVFMQGWSAWTFAGLPLGLWALIGGAYALLRLAGSEARAGWALKPPLAALTLPLVAGNTASVLRAALAAGLLMPDALELAASACGNRVMGVRLAEAGRDLRQHRLESLSAAVARCRLPALMVDLTTSGERSGKLDETLSQVVTLMRESFRLRAEWTARVACGAIYGAAMVAAAAVVFTFATTYFGLINEAMKDQ